MYTFRFYQDIFSANAVAVCYTQHSIIYICSGSIGVNGENLNADNAVYKGDAFSIRAGLNGAVVWRWELVRTEDIPNLAVGDGIVSKLAIARKIKMFEMFPTTRWQFKLDAIVDNQGCTGLHSHPGSGIRCLIKGNLSTVSEKGGDTQNFNSGDCWYEEGAYPVTSTTTPGEKATFMRGMILPPEYAIYPGETPIWIEGKKTAVSRWKGYVSQIIHLR
jgi:uncharacterized cupin superfamily protein